MRASKYELAFTQGLSGGGSWALSSINWAKYAKVTALGMNYSFQIVLRDRVKCLARAVAKEVMSRDCHIGAYVIVFQLMYSIPAF
jgi:hypothetical protein